MTASAYPGTSATQEITDVRPLCHDAHTTQPPDDFQELALMHRIKAGDYDTREQLVASNLLHVLRSNKHYARSGTKIFDLIKAGNQGLVHALESFDAEGNDRFSTYAATYIQQHVERALNPRPVPPARTALPQNGSPGIQPQSV